MKSEGASSQVCHFSLYVCEADREEHMSPPHPHTHTQSLKAVDTVMRFVLRWQTGHLWWQPWRSHWSSSLHWEVYRRSLPPFFEHSSHSEDRKGLKQTSFLNDSGKHFFADIVYSQDFVFEEKKDKTNLVSLHIFSPPSSSPLWYFYIQGASHVFGVKEFWRVLLDLYCLVKCSYNHSPMWSTLSLLSLYFLCSIEGQVLWGILYSVRAIAETPT